MNLSKSISISRKTFTAVSLGYLAIPVLIFFLGFLKIWLGLILSAALIASYVFAIKEFYSNPEDIKTNLTKDETKFSIVYLVFIAIFAVILSFITGIGEYVWTAYDHRFRHAMLNDLVDYKWPVIFSPETQTNPEVIELLDLRGNAFYVYYLCYWLPAALFGKAFGISAANIFLVFWNSLGIVLILLGMSLYSAKRSYVAVLLLVIFSGLDAIPYAFHKLVGYSGWEWYEGYVHLMSMISNIESLLNTFNQCIPCWIAVLLILLSKNSRNVGLYGSLVFGYTPWGTIGLLPLATAAILKKELAGQKAKQKITNLLTIQNLIPPVVILFVFGSFYLCSSGTGVRGFTVEFYDSVGEYILSYLVLILIEVVPFAVVLYKKNKKDIFYWTSIGVLLVLPLYLITAANDFLMRGALSSLFVLNVLLVTEVESVFEAIKKHYIQKTERMSDKSLLKAFSVILMLFCMTYTFYFLTEPVFTMTFVRHEIPEESIGSFGNIASTEFAEFVEYQFFDYDYESQFFYKYLAKK